MLARQLAHAGLVQRHGLGHGGGARGGQAVVEALRQRAALAVAGFVGMLAGLVARHQLQHAQAGCGQLLHGVQRELAARGLGGEEEDLVQPLRRRGLQQREQGAQRLANAGGRLRQQAAAAARGVVDRRGQCALAGAELAVREAQGLQLHITRRAVRQLLPRPDEETAALLGEEGLQLGGRAVFGEDRFLLAGDIEIDQGQFDALQPALGAQQRAVDAQLRPVQGAVRGGLAVEPALVGLDLFESLALGIKAIGAAAHQQFFERAAEAHFALVVGAAPGGYAGMAFNALQG